MAWISIQFWWHRITQCRRLSQPRNVFQGSAELVGKGMVWMEMRRVFRLPVGGAILFLICACQESQPMQTPMAARLATPPRSMGWFDGDGISGSPRIIVRIGEQKAY